MRKLSTFHSVMASLESSRENLEKVFKELGIQDYLFVGGTATIYHGYIRTTSDIDIIISANDFDKVFDNNKIIQEYGFEFGTEGQLDYKDGTTIEFLIEGANFLKDPDMTVPMLKDLKRDSENLLYPDVKEYIRLKCSRGALQDLADVAKIIEIKKITKQELESLNLSGKDKVSLDKVIDVLKL